MKLIQKIKVISLGLLAVTMSTQASRWDDCCQQFFCGNWDVQVKAGVAPIIWNKRGCFTVAQAEQRPNGSLVASLNDFQRLPKFRHFFKTPWTVGFEVGYELTDCVRAYLDFQYRQAKAKDFNLNVPVFVGGAASSLHFNKYKSFSVYIGGDYYFADLWCDSLSAFAGIKVGATRYSRLHLRGTVALAGIPTITVASVDVDQFDCRQTVLSAGGRVGLDYCICGNLSLVLTGEFLAQCGRHLNRLVIPVGNFVPDVRFGSIGTEIVFPVTLGLRYRF